MNFIGVIMSVFGFGMAFGVTIAVGILFYIQVNKKIKFFIYFKNYKISKLKIKSIVKNQTGIEAWILKKVKFKYNLNIFKIYNYIIKIGNL